MAGTHLGIKVDAVLEVARLEQEDIRPVPSMAGGGAAFLRGVAQWQNRMVLLLDGNLLLDEEEHKEIIQDIPPQAQSG